MAEIVIMPKLGVTMETGAVVRWLKTEGDSVAVGDALFEVETDKVTQEVESSIAGILKKILVYDSNIIPVGTPVAIIAGQNEDISGLLNGIRKENSDNTEQTIVLDSKGGQAMECSSQNINIIASPRARKLAKDSGVDLSALAKQIGGARITEDHVKAFLGKEDCVADKTIPYTGIRKIIGEKLLYSYSNKPHIYDVVTVNLNKLMNRRDELKQARQPVPNVSDYIVMACAKALQKNPIVNSTMVEDKITQHVSINIGYAVAADKGLIVPVIKNVERMDMERLTQIRATLVDKALSGSLAPDDVRGGTFTISNLGVKGIKFFTAIINEPEVALLAVGAIEKRVVACENDQIGIAHCFDLTLCSDHRVIDGYIAASTLQDIKNYLES